MKAFDLQVTGSLVVTGSIKTTDGTFILSGSDSNASSSFSSRITTNESNMTLATASIAALTASISRLNTEISTDDTDMTLATASIALNESNMTLATASIAAITASLGQPVNTNSNVTFNDINSTGTITATEIHTTFVSSSIAVSSGSNNFGDESSDHHSFTGSMSISGSLDVNAEDLTISNSIPLIFMNDISGNKNNQIIFQAGGSNIFRIGTDITTNDGTQALEITDGDGNNSRITVNSSGNVGIGTNAGTDTTLTIANSDSSDNSYIIDGSHTATNANGYGARFSIVSTASGRDILTLRSGASGAETTKHSFRGDGSAYHTGNVGIGTTNPTSGKLVVRGSGDTLTLESTNTGAGGAQLNLNHVGGSQADGDFVGRLVFNGQDSNDNAVTYARIDGVAEDVTDTSEKGALNFDTRTDGSNFDTKMRIASGGAVFIGDTANGNMTTGITINQGAADNEIMAFKSSDVSHSATSVLEADTYGTLGKTSGTNGGLMITGVTEGTYRAIQMQVTTIGATNTTKSTAGYGVVDVDVHQGDFGGVTTNGNLMSIGASNVTRFLFDNEGSGHADVEWTTYSDGRLKKNVEDIPYGLNELNKLEPKIYDRYSGKLEDGKVKLEDNSFRQIGFIAQDVKKIIPELIKDIDESESFYSLDDGKLVSVLVKAVQELSSQVTDLKKEIEDLKG